MQSQRIRRTNRELIEQLFRIKNKRRELVRFRFNKSQQLYDQLRTRRNLIVKARRKGLSKVIDADQLMDCIRGFTNAVVISHEGEATKRLFQAVRDFIDNLEVKPAISIDSANAIRFPKTGSTYFIGTAGSRAFGRGDDIHRAHLSEADYYDDLERILGGVSEAAENGQIDIETTVNGRRQVYDMWQKAKGGKSPYTPIFIPWFIDDEYSLDSMLPEESEGLSKGVREMFSIPDSEFMATLDDEEREAHRKIKEEFKCELTAGQMKWRRYKIWDKGRMFYQEYPEDDVSCFLTTGGSVFGKVVVDLSRKIPLDNFDAWNATKERKEEILNRRMYAGMDCAVGVVGGDKHSFSVIDTNEQPAAVIFEYTSDEPIDVFCNKVAKVMQRFRRISLGIEKNGVGVAHVRKMEELRVRFQEWDTGTNRAVMISDLEEAYRKGELVESYKEAEDELVSMVYTEKKTTVSNYRADAPSNKHDDRVMSRAIAWQMKNKPTPGVSWV